MASEPQPLTEAAIRVMPAGPELDELVAKHICGLRLNGTSMVTDPKSHIAFALPRYSTTWNGLGAVVEAMQAKDFLLSLYDGRHNPYGDPEEWSSIFRRQNYDPFVQARAEYAPTAPLAVARAALIALLPKGG